MNQPNNTKNVTIQLFTSPTCPSCPAAKDELKRLTEKRSDFEGVFLETTNPRTQKLAKKYGIMSVPTFIITGPGIDGNMGLVGSQGLEKLNKYVEVALGNESLEKKTSTFKKIMKAIGIEIN